METLTLGGQKIARIGLGTWAIGASEWANIDRADSIACLRKALDYGVNLIDTAPIYGSGRAEEITGEALAQHIAAGGRREDFYIATKFGLVREAAPIPKGSPAREPDKGRVVTNATPQFIAEELERSLRRLNVEYVDLYQFHWPDPLIPMEQVAEALQPLLHAGKIRALGVSNCSPAQMDAFRSVAPLVSNQPPYNIYERAIEREVLPYCDTNGIVTLAYSALCRSMLSGRVTAQSTFTDIRSFDPKFQPPRLAQYAAATAALDQFAQQNYGKRVVHLAIRWILDRSPHTVALWGAHRPQQLEAIPECFGWRLEEAAMQAIDSIVAEHVLDPIGPEYLTPGIRTVASWNAQA
jgi:aryl-alcohol dehydrogenase-like predicted oxidoreductase